MAPRGRHWSALPGAAAALSAAAAAAAAGAGQPLLSPDFVRAINARAPGWTASADQGPHITHAPLEALRGLMGGASSLRRLARDPALPRRRRAEATQDAPPLPARFRSAERWPQCAATIERTPDQSACGSCWAVAAAAAMSDRLCTTGGVANVSLAPFELMSCCPQCCDGYPCNGCDGGYVFEAWTYWREEGLSEEGCTPYPFPPCMHGGSNATGAAPPPCPYPDYTAPLACATPAACHGGRSPRRHYGGPAHSLSGEAEMMREISARGPLQADFRGYADLFAYKSGVYRHVAGELLGAHSVKVTGWGETPDGTPYWEVRNSWNSHWGEDGAFRILRGSDECGIESRAYAGSAAVCPLQQAAPSAPAASGGANCSAPGASCCGAGCCAAGTPCCSGGDGCCPAPGACCGDEGGGHCCSDPQFCCGGVCCRPGVGVCSPDRKYCRR
eukprot:TRINITY_DN20720_c0_g1_i1.p1 TRINITY_DN20720_c0_g1~~TRINITY_DN20720_c0_g1_i1.p1  ORF type:complete len:468 (+),score=92.39 TRINITY_DN20720_c0_g1_i1:71-1405(+)